MKYTKKVALERVNRLRNQIQNLDKKSDKDILEALEKAGLRIEARCSAPRKEVHSKLWSLTKGGLI